MKPFTLLTRTRDRDHSRSEDATMTRGAARQSRASRARATTTRWALVSLLTLLILSSVMARADAQQTRPQATPGAARRAPVWTQVGPEGALVARTLVPDVCPPITLDGSSQPMPPRVGPNGADFPETVCEAPIPAGTGSAAIDGQPLALLPTQLARIAVIGDTGCRIEKDRAQDCSDPDAWPFATIAAQMAAWQPELIIHVGDYFYREAACPTAIVPGCAGSPWGDNLASWRADWFDPAAAITRTATVVETAGSAIWLPGPCRPRARRSPLPGPWTSTPAAS